MFFFKGAPDYSNARSNQRTIPQRNESSKSATVSTKLRTPEIQGSGSSQAQVNISTRIDRSVCLFEIIRNQILNRNTQKRGRLR